MLWPREYENRHAGWIFEWIRDGFARYMPVEPADLPQTAPGLVTFELAADGGRRPVAIDYYDFTHVNEQWVDRVPLYFKFQHLEEGYGRDHVVPGGFVSSGARVARDLGHLRPLGERRQYRYDVYGRFGLRFSAELRRDAVRLLSEQNHFRYEGGLKTTIHGEYLREIAQAKICIDLPGQGYFNHRLVDSLAIGSCVVGYRPKAILPVPLKDGHHLRWCRDDLSDLVELCDFYVHDDEARERVAAAGRDYFDRYLHPHQLQDYYVTTCLERLG